METFLNSLLSRSLTSLQRFILRAVAIGAILALGILRTSTDAEYAFASAAIVPVVVIAWVDGYRSGLFLSFLAAAMWISTDLITGRQFSSHWVPFLNGMTRLATYVLVAYLIARVKTLMVQINAIAHYDALTGLHNRRAFFDAGEEEVMRSRRYLRPLAVAFLDLDDFKRLNDSLGHKTGDLALKAVAAALLEHLRPTDRIARIGGDEFAVILPEVSYQAASEAGNKLVVAINIALEKFPPAAVSIGIAWFENAAIGFPEMMEAADVLMYEIKQAGKRGVRTRRIDPVVPTHGSIEPE